MSEGKNRFFQTKSSDLQHLIGSFMNLALGGGSKDECFRPYGLDNYILCDTYETSDSYIVRAHLSGISKENIKVSIKASDRILIISAVRKRENGADEKVNYIESFQGEMTRRIQLPNTINVNEVTTNHLHGVLELVFKKNPIEQPREISL